MRRWACAGLLCALVPGLLAAADTAAPRIQAAAPRVWVLPIREDIATPLVYVVRRGVKEAMEAHADYLVLDMETNGGSADATLQIMEILNQFPGQTVTYVNRNAYSAGAFIAVSTQRIYMAPEAVIGAAAPIMLSPGGMGVQEMPSTVEVKMTSALSAKVRAYAQKHGHNPDVVEAMIDKQKELKLDGQTLNEKGRILTLTNKEAERDYGNPPKPLLSAGTVENLAALWMKLGLAGAERTTVQPSGAERLASWINALSWLWLIIGVAGLYIEFKTPGFGLPGVIGICGFVLYFLGSYVAGLAGWEWPILFLLGLGLVAAELFFFPGTILPGLIGAALMLVSVVMALVDRYPGTPPLPTLPQLQLPLRNLVYAGLGSLAAVLLIARWFPGSPLYQALVSRSASGTNSVAAQDRLQSARVGMTGVALSVLRPGGKARFGDAILDVMTEGDMIAKGTPVRIIGNSGREAIVEAIAPS